MVAASKVSIVEWLASSFYKRDDSVANKEVTKGNTLLAPDEIDMLATLRMSKEFMRFMRESHAHLSLMNFQDFIECIDEKESLNPNSL